MRLKRRELFTTVVTEGAILPADLLQRISDGDQGLDGLTPESYHLDGRKITEVISGAWNRLLGIWSTFEEAREKLPEHDIGTSITRERWLLPLFEELRYGRLQTAKAIEIEGKSYPISHLWQSTPIHLVGCKIEIDKRTPGVTGAARMSPHSMVQEFLNRSDDHLWAFLSNGRRLRILRDNVSLTRQAYVEFDFEAMMRGEVYSDFVLLWLLCHQSRVESERPETCWLEQWSQASVEQGARALETLRNGVEEAIVILGQGFLAHPRNGRLREKLQTGQLEAQDYYRQLLRLVYRLIFLFVADDRGLLLDPEADEKAKERYLQYYSTNRIRQLAEKRRGSRHPDLYQALKLVMGILGKEGGCPELALPALGSFLWSKKAISNIEECNLTNRNLLDAVRALAFVEEARVQRPVDYKNIGPEELGSIYEALLELHPEIHAEAATFDLNMAAGHERKTTGSYYTPTSLVNALIDSALEPVVEDRLKDCKTTDEREKAILNLKVCDPATGSGHFLVAAAHRLAKHLAAIRSEEEEPAPEYYQDALRDVIGHCVYGVDINPMAVELCKVSLWMEALEPGKPLSFLEQRIQCGNSLLGTTPALIAKGIPDEAFKPIEGDDKKVASLLKKKNREEREQRKRYLALEEAHAIEYGAISDRIAEFDTIPDDTLQEVERKEVEYERLHESQEYLHAKLVADAWCATFIWRKTMDTPHPMTQEAFRQIREDPNSAPTLVKGEIERLSEQYQFFHWYLAFPDVFHLPDKGHIPKNDQYGWKGGFDCVIGNPPWEAVDLLEKEFFASRSPDIAAAATTSERRRLISELEKQNSLHWQEWKLARRQRAATSHFWNHSGRFPLGSIGKLNTYRLFAELGVHTTRHDGRCGIILKSGIITGVDNQQFASGLIESGKLVTVVDFINTNLIFTDVVANERFCLFTVRGSGKVGSSAKYAFTLDDTSQIADQERFFTLSPREITLLNPNDHSVSPIASHRDKLLVLHVHQQVNVLVNESEDLNPWGVRYCQGHLNSSTGSKEFSDYTYENLIESGAYHIGEEIYTLEGTRYIPYYEGKFIGQLNHRFGTFKGVPPSQRFGIKAEANDPSIQDLNDLFYEIRPRYWVPELTAQELYDRKQTNYPWLFSFRDVCRAIVDARTIKACILPLRPCNHKCCLLAFDVELEDPATAALVLNATWASFMLDYILRQKLPGSTLTKGIAYQLPVPNKSVLHKRFNRIPLLLFILPRILELTYVTSSLQQLAGAIRYDGLPFKYDEERRFLIRCEIDAVLFHIYLGSEDVWQANDAEELRGYFPTPQQAIEYIMETFSIVKRRDEAAYGTYRTKDIILEIYDEMAECMKTGRSYQTRLDPPPGPPCDEEGSFIPMEKWDSNNWPVHIHRPRE